MSEGLGFLGDEWWWFLVDRHLDRMLRIVDELEWWTREAVLGADVGRERDAEFSTSGTVAELTARADVLRRQLREDLELTRDLVTTSAR